MAMAETYGWNKSLSTEQLGLSLMIGLFYSQTL